MEDKEQYTVPNDGTLHLDLAKEGKDFSRIHFNITPDFLKSMGYGLDDCKHLLSQLQNASKAVMMYAWENKFHVELAAHISGLKVPNQEAGTNEKSE